jgi:uncharacterized membrane protein YgcG
MGTAGRSAPLRRTGSLLGLLGLELAAVLALHWLGRFAGLRIRWDEPVRWLLSSPVQEVLGALLRTVALVMAYWLLASTVLYLLASLTRLPAAVRAVGWATLPLARRVADHAVTVTLATSMVGTSTLGVAGPALAADSRGSIGPPAPKPVAAAQATSSTALQDAPSTSAGEATEPSPPAYVPKVQAPTSRAEQTTEPTEPADPAYTPNVAGQEPRRLPAAGPAPPTTTTTTTTAPTTTTTTTAPTTTSPPTTTTAPTTTAAARSGAAPTTTASQPAEGGGRQGAATTSTAGAGLRDPVYEFNPATSTTLGPGEREAAEDDAESGNGGGGGGGGGSGESSASGGGGTGGGGTGGSGGGGSESGKAREGQEQEHEVVAGDNLWVIARDHLAGARSGGSGGPTTREVAQYWAKVVEANRDRLRSGDPDLIYPKERIILPPLD